jgi:acyl-CoA thioesterase FadM
VDCVGSSSWTIAFTVRAAHERDDGATVYGVAVTPPADATPDERPIIATGRMTIVAMDPATERARPIPEELRHALTGE